MNSIKYFAAGNANPLHAPVFTYAPLLAAWIADLLLNAMGWAYSSAVQTDHLYDLTGACSHVLAVLISFLVSTNRSMRNLLATLMVCVWAVRLGGFLFIRVLQAGGDRRLEKYLKRPLLFAVPWFMQSLWVMFNVLPLLILNSTSDNLSVPLEWYDWLSLAGWVAGFLIEVVADEQKRIFRAHKSNSSKFIREGLWAWSRHPNYFGEILLQVSFAAFCAPGVLACADAVGRAGSLASGSAFWIRASLLSPLFIVWLLTSVSGVPLLEKDNKRRWQDNPDWKLYVESTPVLFPMPPKKLNYQAETEGARSTMLGR